METVDLREKLCDYIRSADDEKVKAMYTLLEDAIEAPVQWWEDDAFVAELDKEYDAFEKGEVKGYTMEEAMEYLAQKKRERHGSI